MFPIIIGSKIIQNNVSYQDPKILLYRQFSILEFIFSKLKRFTDNIDCLGPMCLQTHHHETFSSIWQACGRKFHSTFRSKSLQTIG